MMRRWFILGILMLVMVILLRNFYLEVVVYDPLKEIESAEKATKEGEKMAGAVFEEVWGDEIHEKNLFSPMRGHLPEPSQVLMVPKGVEADIKPPERPILSLKGIIRNQFGEYIAIIEKGNAKAMPLRKGDMLDDVLVVEIKEKVVELMWNNENIRLSMEKVKTLKRVK